MQFFISENTLVTVSEIHPALILNFSSNCIYAVYSDRIVIHDCWLNCKKVVELKETNVHTLKDTINTTLRVYCIHIDNIRSHWESTPLNNKELDLVFSESSINSFGLSSLVLLPYYLTDSSLNFKIDSAPKADRVNLYKNDKSTFLIPFNSARAEIEYNYPAVTLFTTYDVSAKRIIKNVPYKIRFIKIKTNDIQTILTKLVFEIYETEEETLYTDVSISYYTHLDTSMYPDYMYLNYHLGAGEDRDSYSSDTLRNVFKIFLMSSIFCEHTGTEKHLLKCSITPYRSLCDEFFSVHNIACYYLVKKDDYAYYVLLCYDIFGCIVNVKTTRGRMTLTPDLWDRLDISNITFGHNSKEALTIDSQTYIYKTKNKYECKHIFSLATHNLEMISIPIERETFLKIMAYIEDRPGYQEYFNELQNLSSQVFKIKKRRLEVIQFPGESKIEYERRIILRHRTDRVYYTHARSAGCCAAGCDEFVEKVIEYKRNKELTKFFYVDTEDYTKSWIQLGYLYKLRNYDNYKIIDTCNYYIYKVLDYRPWVLEEELEPPLFPVTVPVQAADISEEIEEITKTIDVYTPELEDEDEDDYEED